MIEHHLKHLLYVKVAFPLSFDRKDVGRTIISQELHHLINQNLLCTGGYMRAMDNDVHMTMKIEVITYLTISFMPIRMKYWYSQFKMVQ